MMLPGLEQVRRSVIRGVLGFACAGGAAVFAGTLAAGMLWTAALALACLGYGGVIDRLARRHWSTPISLVTGLSVLLGLSTLVAHVGLLFRSVQIAAVFAGIALCLLPHEHAQAPRAPRSMKVYALAAAAFAVGVELLVRRVSFEDAFPHVLYVKRLWDTGALGLVHHQTGLQVVGESYVSLMSGAAAAGVFELGGCVALFVYVISSELAANDTPLAAPLAFLLTVPAVLWPGMSVQWSGVVLHVAMFIALQRALDAKVRAWHVLAPGLALVLLRHEYLIVALPYLALAARPRWSRRSVAVAIVVWFVLLIPYQLALAVPPGRALLNSALLVIALALVPAARRLIGKGSGADALGALVFANIMYGLALLLDAIRPAQHSDGAIVTVCFGGAACICWLLARRDDARIIHLGAATIVLALLVGYTITGPSFGGGHYAASRRVVRAAVALRQTLVFGAPHDLEDAVAALQKFVPRHARIGFWGESAGKLDFRRNPISDLTHGDKRSETMAPITETAARHVDYLLLENLAPRTPPGPWASRMLPTSTVGPELELRAASDGAFLFRVRH